MLRLLQRRQGGETGVMSVVRGVPTEQEEDHQQ